MKYFVLLAGDGDVGPWDQLTPEEQQATFAKFGAFDAACAERPGVETLGGEALEDGGTATTLRTRDGELTITDGPFAEATEQIGGFYVIEAPDLDTITDLCRSLPAHRLARRLRTHATASSSRHRRVAFPLPLSVGDESGT